MRYKDVFLIWLIADGLLAAGSIILSLISSNFADGEFGFALVIIAYGIAFSLPSLAVMLLFHAIFNSSRKSNYQGPYLFLIIVINLLYLLMGRFFLDMILSNYMYLIGSTTLAGLLAFAIVDRMIRKRLKHLQAD